MLIFLTALVKRSTDGFFFEDKVRLGRSQNPHRVDHILVGNREREIAAFDEIVFEYHVREYYFVKIKQV